MGVLRYLLVIVLVGTLAMFTVAEHVERTRLGYEVRSLEAERQRLAEAEKVARISYERALAPERLVQRAQALRVASAADLQALTGARR